ncbi:MAG: hypothetical protein Q7P63_04015 [Verrucomicrobiota bacterium JB022]|nr:hypothetical protein [Verrucomicrobiota bacterium JB022]
MPTETHYYSPKNEPSPAQPHDEAGHGDTQHQGFRETAREQSRHLKDEVKERAREARHNVQSQVESGVDAQRHRFSDVIRGYGDAAHAAADEMRGEESSLAGAGDYLDRLADTCYQAGDYLEDRSLREMADDASSWVRRHPGVSFGLAFAAGFALSRVLTASPVSQYEDEGPQDDWPHTPENTPRGQAYSAHTEGEWRVDPSAPQRPKTTAADPAALSAGTLNSQQS